MPTDTAPIAQTIGIVARSLGVDPYLAIATAMQESGLDPRAVGDNGTSFGLFQLHAGGELGELSPEQAFDPTTNARVALQVLAHVAQANPNMLPGQLAAAAQRPNDQIDYANDVQRIYNRLTSPPTATLYRYLRETAPQLWGMDVWCLQVRMHVPMDHVFGPVTLSALQTWQHDHSLTADGIVGPLTCKALGWTWAGPGA